MPTTVTIDVIINGTPRLRMGLDSLGCLGVALGLSRMTPAEEGNEEAVLELTGVQLTPSNSQEFVRWAQQTLRVGDRVELRIDRQASFDPPRRTDLTGIKGA